MLAVRNGQDHLESLRDGRDVSINDERVADVTIHEAFRNSVRSAARLYDFQADPAHVEAMTFASPDSRRRVSRCWQLPRFYAELVERRRALEAWAGLHFGFMGRSPDHVASCISGLYMGLDLFEAAVLYFDDVKVPWERVFVNQDIDMTLRQFHSTPAHVFQNYQCQIRLLVKLRFLAGIAHGIAEANGIIGFPQVRETLGQIAAEVGLVDGLVHGMEAKGSEVGDRSGSYFVPDRHLLYTAQVLTQQLYPKMITTIRELAGGGLIMVPSSVADFADPGLAAIIDKTQQSPAFTAQERVKFFKLAWDALGSEFASRHVQYEMFYAGAAFATRGHSYRTFDWAGCKGMVDGLMASYPTPAAPTRKSGAVEA